MKKRHLIDAAVLVAAALVLSGCGLFNNPPEASFTVLYHVDADDPLWVTLDASASSDPDGDLLVAYQWNFGVDLPGVEFLPTGYTTRLVTDPVITVRYPLEGTYTMTLAVRDEHGTNSLTVSQTFILPPPPPVVPLD
jgi:hypothetical protein